jgi:hypothetical protein
LPPLRNRSPLYDEDEDKTSQNQII